MSNRKQALIPDDVQPLSQDEIARFRDQFTSTLLRRCLKTIDLQREEIQHLKDECAGAAGRRQKTAR
jgi:hypothetical protein